MPGASDALAVTVVRRHFPASSGATSNWAIWSSLVVIFESDETRRCTVVSRLAAVP